MSVFLIVTILLLAVFLYNGVHSVPKGYISVVFRLGSYSHILRAGTHFVTPVLDRSFDVALEELGDNAGIAPEAVLKERALKLLENR